MEDIGQVTLTTIHLFGKVITFNALVFITTWYVMGLLLIGAFLIRRKLAYIPNKFQAAFEFIYLFLEDVTVSTLGEKDGRKFFPFILTIFVFILASNWIGLFPNFFQFIGTIFALIHKLFGGDLGINFKGITNIFVELRNPVWYDFLFKIPHTEEPTKFLATDLGLAILVFFVVHVNAIKSKGLLDYFKDYMEPLPSKPPYIYFFFLNPFFYLNIIGEIAKVVSHSFRLFGNIFGGSIIILIVSELLRYLFIPVGLHFFFGIFAGGIQAFVFTMLAVTYIAVMK